MPWPSSVLSLALAGSPHPVPGGWPPASESEDADGDADGGGRARRVSTCLTSSPDSPRHYLFFFGLFSDDSSTPVTVGRTSSCTASTLSSAVRSYTTAPRNSLRTTR